MSSKAFLQENICGLTSFFSHLITISIHLCLPYSPGLGHVTDVLPEVSYCYLLSKGDIGMIPTPSFLSFGFSNPNCFVCNACGACLITPTPEFEGAILVSFFEI